MRRHGVPLVPLPEEQLHNLTDDSPRLPVDALYFVTPNNPTGRSLTKQQFENIVAYCKKYRMLLIIDFCFRFYGDFWDFDQYEILQSAGIDFITTEDTGKSWPAADVKLGMVLGSQSIYVDLKSISDDFLLSVSPFVFALLSEYIGLESRSRRRIKSQDVVDANRQTIRKILGGSPIRCISENTHMSVEWLKLPTGWKAASFSDRLVQHGIQVLPGERFYWHKNIDGQRYFRVALLREKVYFRKAIKRLLEIAETYQP